MEQIHLYLGRRNKPPVVELIEKGYSYEAVQWEQYRPYTWRFDVNGSELVIIYNDQSHSAVWSGYLNDKLSYQGNYIGLIRRYPYLYNYIEYI
jgi:hypothetical protein